MASRRDVCDEAKADVPAPISGVSTPPEMQEGQIATKNGRGQQMATLNPLYKAWCGGSAASPEPVLVDCGAAYGINSLQAAQDRPRARVVAVDVEAAHLECIDAAAKAAGGDIGHRLSTSLAEYLPKPLPLEAASVTSMLVGEVLHFCSGEEVLLAFKEFMRVLQPGGTLCVTTHTGLSAPMRSFFNVSEEQHAELNKAREAVVKAFMGPAATLADSVFISESEVPAAELVPRLKAALSFPGALDKAHMHEAMARMCREEGYDLPESAWPSFFHCLPVEMLAGAAAMCGFEIVSAENGHHPGVVSRLKTADPGKDTGDAQLVCVKPRTLSESPVIATC